MFEDLYFWKKNGRPDTSKNHTRNGFCHYVYDRFKTENVIMKTIHSGDFDGYYTKNDGLVPFVSYSLNKKSRWKLNNALELLEEIKDGDSEVFVIERIDIHCSPYRCYVPFPQYFQYFPIQNLHTLHDSYYEHISINSALGQPLKSLLPENRLPQKPESNDLKTEEPSKVAVSFIRPPKNFEKLRSRHFYTGRGDAKDYRADVYKKRFKAIDDMVFEVKYDQLDIEDEVMDTYEDDYLFIEEYIGPSHYYNLEDHYIDKWFFVKRRRSNSSNWSIVSES